MTVNENLITTISSHSDQISRDITRNQTEPPNCTFTEYYFVEHRKDKYKNLWLNNGNWNEICGPK